MQVATAKFTKTDLAKYPFLKETAEYVRKLDLKIEDLVNPEYAAILERAEERVEDAILSTLVFRDLREPEKEIPSFPVAVILVVATKDSFIRKRYALAEAEQALADLQDEPKEKILAIAQDFEWKLEHNPGTSHEFALHFTDYLRNIATLRDKEWKFVNQVVSHGKVYLNQKKILRLLKEEVQRRIEKRLGVQATKFPTEILARAEKLKNLTVETVGTAELTGFPKTVEKAAFPPCITNLYQTASSGRHLSHIGRFALTSFLVSIGMPTESIIDLFRSFSDFNERLTRYQVEHIAGERGSRTAYIPPMCETLQTHGVCVNPDDVCQTVRHPLHYYRRRMRNLK